MSPNLFFSKIMTKYVNAKSKVVQVVEAENCFKTTAFK